MTSSAVQRFLGGPAGRGPVLLVGIDRAHQADGDPIGVFDDGVARAPEGVEGRLQAAVPEAGKLVVGVVHRISRIDAEAEYDAPNEVIAAAPTLIPELREGRAVEIELAVAARAVDV